MSKTPFGNLPPSRVNFSGFLKYSTISASSSLASSHPLTSSNVFKLFSGIVSLLNCFGSKFGPPPFEPGPKLEDADEPDSSRGAGNE